MTEPNVIVNIIPRTTAEKRLDILIRVVQGAYALYLAWEMAKVINPDLANCEREFRAQVKKYFTPQGESKRDVNQNQADAFVAEVTKFVRDNGN